MLPKSIDPSQIFLFFLRSLNCLFLSSLVLILNFNLISINLHGIYKYTSTKSAVQNIVDTHYVYSSHLNVESVSLTRFLSKNGVYFVHIGFLLEIHVHYNISGHSIIKHLQSYLFNDIYLFRLTNLLLFSFFVCTYS